MVRPLLCSLACAAFLAGCTCSPNYSLFSGSVTNDDFEEPLSLGAQKYAPLLVRSNEMMALLQQGRTQEVYDRFFDDSLKKQVSASDFAKLYASVLGRGGPVRFFRAQQWRFTVQRGLVTSTKIVHHVGGMLNYEFTFADKDATRIIGIHFRPHPQVVMAK